MILLNGVAPILGATIIHVVIINIIAIFVEYAIIKRRFRDSKLMLRVVLSNLISVVVGSIVIYAIPDLMGAAIDKPDSYIYNNYDKLAVGAGLACLFLSNVLIETPAYLIGTTIVRKDVFGLISVIFLANLVTNVPVVLIYMLFVN
jgi:hypothetical protein